MNEESSASTIQTLRSWITSSCEILSIILNQGVYPEPCESSILSLAEFREKQKGLCFPIRLLTGVEGEIFLLFSKSQAATLIDLLVGGSGIDPSEDLLSQHRTVLHEALLQLVSGLGDMLTHLQGKSVKVQLKEVLTEMPDDLNAPEYLWMDFPLTLDEGPMLGLTLALDSTVAEQLSPPAPAPAPARPAAAESTKAVSQPAPVIKAEKHKFTKLEASKSKARKEQLDVILEVPLQVQVVLGRTSILVQDLIHLGEGTILELDKMAGEPVELYIHDRMVALGEVIVVDERFGVKVLELAEHRKPPRSMAS